MASKRHTAPAGKPPSQRQLRVGEELRHALADLFRRGDFHDPELADLNITVTEVRISPDLRNATAFVTPLGGGHAGEALVVLRRAAPFLRSQIARSVNLRYAPTLSFEADTSFDYASHIDSILHRPEVARDLTDRVNGDDHDDEDEDDDWEDDSEDEDDVEYEDDDDLDEEGDGDGDDAEYEDDDDLDDADGDDADGDDAPEYEDDEDGDTPPSRSSRRH